MDRLDAHCHFWALGRGDYGWLAGSGGPLDAIRRDFGPADYPGTGPLIAVQAAPSEAETRYLLSLDDPRIIGVVGWVDLADPNAAGALERLASHRRLRGIRPMLQDIADTDWLLTAPDHDALHCMVALDLVFDALVTLRHLPVLARFAARNEGLRIVIDHAAKPQPGQEDDWAREMQFLARQGHCCKLSGLLTELPAADLADPLTVLRPRIGRLLDWFGPERLIWGSDWPVLTLAAGYDDWLALTEALLEGLTPDERAAVMGGTACRVYGVTP